MRLVAAVMTVSVSALLVVVTATSAWACSCAPMSLQEQMDRSDVVFVGTAVEQVAEVPREVVSSADPVTWTFTVDRVHKGVATAPQQVATVRSEATCGFAFTAGRNYLVMGTGAVSTGLCDGTRPASAVTVADGAVLGEGTVPAVAPVPAADPIPEPEAPAPPPWWLVGVPVVALLGGAWWYRRRA